MALATDGRPVPEEELDYVAKNRGLSAEYTKRTAVSGATESGWRATCDAVIKRDADRD